MKCRLAFQILACLAILPPVGMAPAWAQQHGLSLPQWRIELGEGRQLTPADAEILEAQLQVLPESLSIRTKLLGYYFAGSGAGGRHRLKPDTQTVIMARRTHILWVIRNRPWAPVAGDPAATIDPAGHPLADRAGYSQAKGLWQQQAKLHSDNTAVLGNAAMFLKLHDKELAENMLVQAMALEPDSKWSGQKGYLYALAILGVNGVNQNGLPYSYDPEEAGGAFAKKAAEELNECIDAVICGTAGSVLYQYGLLLNAFAGRSLEPETLELSERSLQKARALQPANPAWVESLSAFYDAMRERATSPVEKQEFALKSLEMREELLRAGATEETKLRLMLGYARAAFAAGDNAKARSAAYELLELASQSPTHVSYGPAIHHGNLILGHLALQEDSLGQAKDHLLSAARIPGGGTLGSFGPDMALAKELLELGESGVVLEYLQLCRGFWSTGVSSGILDQWVMEIKRGEIPEF